MQEKKYTLGVATATGMTALYGKKSGVDFILVLNSGKFRQMGRSSLGGYLAFQNSNDFTMKLAEKEIIPTVGLYPLFVGINGTDPNLDLNQICTTAKKFKIKGIVNYPTVCLFDGQFREALEESEVFSFQKEVSLLKKAKEKGLSTIGFVATKEEALMMSEASVDFLCIHLGLTEGGHLGAKLVATFQNTVNRVREITETLENNKNSSKVLIYGGIINDLTELRYIYNQVPAIEGYIGGSTFERIGSEELIIHRLQKFKKAEETENDNLTVQILEGIENYYQPVDFIKRYIEENYSVSIRISELAEFLHINSSYLSTLFKKKIGISFTEYLVRFRINKAIELMENPELSLKEIALMVNYSDYPQFNKIFKEHIGSSPKVYRRTKI